jgi:hypothetical protein
MTKFALDTNIVSYYLKGDKTIIEKINAETKNGRTANIKSID